MNRSCRRLECAGEAVRQFPVFLQDRLQTGNPGLINLYGKRRQEFLISYGCQLLSAMDIRVQVMIR